MEYNNKLYEEISTLKNEADYIQFSRKNMIYLTRFKPNLLLDRLNDDSPDEIGKQQFDKFFIYELDKISKTQNTAMARIVESFTIQNSLLAIDYFEDLKRQYPENDNLKYAQYHIAMNVMKFFSEPTEKQLYKRADYFMFNETISPNVANKLIQSVAQCVDINSSYDEQGVVLNFLYQNKLELPINIQLEQLVKNSEQMKDWLDIFVDKERQKFTDTLKTTVDDKKELIGNQLINDSSDKLLAISTLFSQTPNNQDFRHDVIMILNKKINKITEVLNNQHNDVYSKHFYNLMESFHNPLKTHLHLMDNVKQNVNNDIQIKPIINKQVNLDNQEQKVDLKNEFNTQRQDLITRNFSIR